MFHVLYHFLTNSSGARVSVEILDKQLDDDENINSKLISKFHPIASLSPKLPSVSLYGESV